jgi:hypothetical protein
MRWVALGGLALVFGCMSPESARRQGLLGWYRADLPPHSGKYQERFGEVPMLAEASTSCDTVRGQQFDSSRPIFVLVPGAGGEGPEMDAALPRLNAWGPSSIYMFRWVPMEKRDELIDRLARGISRIAECVRDSKGRILVIGHSAGGVLASYAAARVVLPDRSPGTWIQVLTVSSMLAGNVPRGDGSDERQRINFLFDLGTRITHYPPPVAGIHVVHLRTTLPGDISMIPLFGHHPNDPRIGVPGAPQIDLPGRLDHGGALEYVLRGVVEGWADDWLRTPPEVSTATAGR